jgi:hypothetical protein
MRDDRGSDQPVALTFTGGSSMALMYQRYNFFKKIFLFNFFYNFAFLV